MKQTPRMQWRVKNLNPPGINWLACLAMKVLGMAWLVTISAVGKDFVAPAEGPTAFRRDRVPLDTDAMANLSRQLVTLAEGLDGATPVSRRGAAQMLALSIALDPSNNKARGLISRFQNKDFEPSTNEDPLKTSRENIWKILEWLSTPEAGESGNALAACLTDVILLSDPTHPSAGNLLSKGEQGAWKSWIPDLAAYDVKPPALAESLTEKSENQDTPQSSFKLLPSAKVFTPLWKNIGRPDFPNWVLAPGALEMTAKVIDESEEEDGEDRPFSIKIGSDNGENSFAGMNASLLSLMKQMNEGTRLPKDYRVTIGGKALEHSGRSGMRQSISAAAAVLTSAAITGQEPDATIIGVIDRNGKFTLPTGFWEQLMSLTSEQGKKGRLILPAAASDYLPALLVLEKPQFFFDYEVVLASNFPELLALSAKNPNPNLAKISASFEEIRAKAPPQSLGQYLANPHVLRRLLEIIQQEPSHHSAKLLAIQGAGNRPIYFQRTVLVAEIQRAIKPIQWIITRESPYFEDDQIAKVGPSYESSRSALDALTRNVARTERELLDKAQELVAKIRTMERAVRKKSGEFFDGEEFFQGGISEYAAVIKAHQNLLALLGEPPEDTKSSPDR